MQPSSLKLLAWCRVEPRHFLRVAALALVVAGAGMSTGCLDRKVVATGPQTSNQFVDQIVQTSVDKIDLLFMVDNSTSMADKQDILRAAVPVLVRRLVSTCTGCDLDLLAQRKAFLRPDSLVAIVMLSDENDCSIRDDGQGWFVATSGTPMPKATAVCASNPNDPCCRSCGEIESAPPSGCTSLAADPVCGTATSSQTFATWDQLHDSPDLRCYDQRRRFGFDLLYETARYVTGLTSQTLTLQSDGKTVVTNPLYDTTGSSAAPRDPSLVFLAGIVGVPWQDIADSASLSGPGLNYLTAEQLLAQGRWATLLGDPTASPPVPPSDPFMVESVLPRSGQNPITHDPIVSDTSTDPTESPINGHEQNPTDQADLQFACTFPRAAPKACGPRDAACDCSPTKAGDLSLITAYNSPLCQPPGGGAPGTIQSYAKGYPGARELAVLKDFGANAVVASICPKVTTSPDPASDPNYGYNPAVAAIIERLKVTLNGKCLPRAIQTEPTTHQVACEVIEAQKSGCDCTLPGRGPADTTVIPAVEAQLQAAGRCGNAGQPPCSSYCECTILQDTGADLTACEAGQNAAPGFCYVDDPSSPLLKNCPANQKQLLRFVDATHKTPANGALAFIACLGAPIVTVPDGGTLTGQP